MASSILWLAAAALAVPITRSNTPETSTSIIQISTPSINTACDGTKNVLSNNQCIPCEKYLVNGVSASYGTDAFRIYGCLSPTKCPKGGSWSVALNKCSCLPETPFWNPTVQECISATTSTQQALETPTQLQPTAPIQPALPFINTICDGTTNIQSEGRCIPCDQYQYKGLPATNGTDAFGAYGCISPFQCPPGGSWSVSENRCKCLPETPLWNPTFNVCGSPNKVTYDAYPAAQVPEYPARKVVYIDNANYVPTGFDLSVPGYADNAYNVIMLAFWLDNGGPWDVLRGWTQLDSDTRQSYLDAYHKAGKIVLVSAFGATEWPTRDGIDPITSANRIADFVIQFGLDGVDVDYEDSDAFNAGTAEQWLITYTKTLRLRLPASRYTISHAPQAPYFFPNAYPGGGYLAVHKAVGGMIDFYNVQFYNQGSLSYDTCESLFYDAQGSSVFEIAQNGVPLNKIVVGKPITHQGVVNSGYMDPWKLAACIPDAKAKGWSGGVMGWQYSLDPSFQWISAVSSQL